ncbi:hypothetical protein ACFYVK_19650 [Streptomyces chartreusis]|uniref:hypothetical protein n=1 Tax=Streptomyces chartreusis TaxID=1969 RepID=UPI0036AC8503
MTSAKSDQSSSERFSVTFVPPAAQAVRELMEVTGLNKADVINRAVQIYAFLEDRKRKGSDLLLRSPDGETERVHIV